MERTLAIIKPDAMAAGLSGQIMAIMLENGFGILGMKKLQLSRAQAEGFYAVHRERPFFQPLVKFMTEGSVMVLALEREDAIRKWRDTMGATDPAKAAVGTIRNKCGASIERNCVHGSDSPENAAIELAFFFSTAELL